MSHFREPTQGTYSGNLRFPEPLPLMLLVGETFNVVGQRTSRSPYLREGFGSGIRKADSDDQHYPPGTQENYNSFLSRDLVMRKGKELEFHEGPGGLESASRILMTGGSP